MSMLRAMLSRGASGVPAEPVSFATLTLPRSPNACLAAPPGDAGPPAQEESPVFAADPDAVLRALDAVAAGQPRVHRLAAWPALRQVQWVERSARANFPDVIAAEAVEVPGSGTSLRLYSRSLIGWSDLGANRARVRRWLAALQAELARMAREEAEAEAALAHAAPAEPEPEGPGTAMERAVSRRARGRRVIFAWDHPEEAPALVLRALAFGATEARVAARHRPANADQLLASAGDRAGLRGEAERVLETAACAADTAPPSPNNDTSRPRAWWVRATLEEPDIRARLGAVDVVVCGVGLMQWWQDPPRRLRDLHRTGASELVLRTAVLPVTPALAAEGFAPGVAWHAGELTAAQAAALDDALRARGVGLPQFAAVAGPMTREAAAAARLDGPWWWFMSEACVERLLRDAGWTVTGVVADDLFPVFLAVRA